MKVKKLLDKVSDALDKVCGFLIVLMIAAMVICTMAQIVCRLWFRALSWSEEVTRYLLIWSTFIGMTCVYRHNGNIAITIIPGMLPEKGKRALQILVHVICTVLFVVLFYYSIQYSAKLVKMATALPIRMKYIFSCIPISMGIAVIHAVRLVVDEIVGEPKEKEA